MASTISTMGCYDNTRSNQIMASTNRSVLARYRPSIGPVPGRYCKTVPGQYRYGVQNRIGPVLACGIGPVPPTVLGQYWASTVMFAGGLVEFG